MNKMVLMLGLITFIYALPAVQAGQVENLNINASGKSKVKVEISKESKIKKINVKKSKNSSVKIDLPKTNCQDNDIKNNICKP